MDPLGLPLVTQVVAGKAADDPLDIPAIQQVSQSMPEHGVLYVGDCKMAALATRAYVQAQGDYYLCPLAQTQLPAQELERYLQPVWSDEQPLVAVQRAKSEEEDEVIAQGFEQTVVCNGEVAGQVVTWSERQVLVRSVKLAEAAQATLHAHLGKAQAALTRLNEHKQGKKVYRDADALQHAAQAICKHHQVEGLLRLRIEEQASERAVRAYGSRQAEVRVERSWQLHSEVDEAAVSEAMRRLGWRVSVTNHPQQTLSLEQTVVLATLHIRSGNRHFENNIPLLHRLQTRVDKSKIRSRQAISCSSDDNLIFLRRSFCCGPCSFSSPAVETFLLGHPSRSLSSLDETSQYLIAARNTHGPWQKQIPAHHGKCSLTPAAHHSQSAGETTSISQSGSNTPHPPGQVGSQLEARSLDCSARHTAALASGALSPDLETEVTGRFSYAEARYGNHCLD